AAASSRGLFELGFPAAVFHDLKPLAQRLAVYPAKVFTSQAVHRRAGGDLARGLPVEAKNPSHARQVRRRAADALRARRAPILAGYAVESSPGRWLASFRRARVARGPWQLRRPGDDRLPAADRDQVDRIVAAVGSDADRLWWAQCVRRL